MTNSINIKDHNLTYQDLKNEIDIITSVFHNEYIKNTLKVNKDKSIYIELLFKDNYLLKEDDYTKIIEELKLKDRLKEIISNDKKYLYLDYKIKISYLENIKTLTLIVDCFWLKKYLTVIENEFKHNIYNCNQTILFDLINFIKEYSDNFDKRKSVLNWLLKLKEEEYSLSDNKAKLLINSSDALYSNDSNESNYNLSINEMLERTNKLRIKQDMLYKNNNNNKDNNLDVNKNEEYLNLQEFEKLGGFISEAIIDRKSTFQAFVIKLNSEKDINIIKNILISNKKIAKSTHNITSYRLLDKKNVNFGYDDDGEAKAGERLLELLNSLNVVNVFCMVSRWYGGIKIGNARFKHINDSVKDIIINNKSKFDFL